MTRQKQFEVRSDRDNGVVFPKETVQLEARLRRVSLQQAAIQLARENHDDVTGETLFAAIADASE